MDTLSKAVQQASVHLEQAGVDEPRRDARLLVAIVTGADITATFTHPERTLTTAEQTRLNQLLSQRVARRPMSQILGSREFWSLEFAVSSDVLTPRPDSETLVEAVLAALPDRNAPLRLLDLGTGSGCLLLALLSELPAAHGIGVDASPAAARVAQANARALGLTRRAAFVVGNWTAAIAGGFDLILSNPPYIPKDEISTLMPEVVQFEPHLALVGGMDGYDAYREIIPTLPAILVPQGLVALEIGAGMGKKTAEIATDSGFSLDSGHCDLAGVERCLILRQDKNRPIFQKKAWNSGH